MTKIYQKYQKLYDGKQGFINPKKMITYKQFLENLEYQMLMGRDIRGKPELKEIRNRERNYHQKEYQVNDYPN